MRLFHRSRSRRSGAANLAELRRKSSRLRRGGGCTSTIFTPVTDSRTRFPTMQRGWGEWAVLRRKGCVPACQTRWLPALPTFSRERAPETCERGPDQRNENAKTLLILKLNFLKLKFLPWWCWLRTQKTERIPNKLGTAAQNCVSCIVCKYLCIFFILFYTI